MPEITNLKALGKYLDQPALVKKFNDKIPAVITAGAAGCCLYDTYKSQEGERKKTFIRSASTLFFTVASALVATRGVTIGKNKIFKGLIELPHVYTNKIFSFSEIKKGAVNINFDLHRYHQNPFGELKKLSLLGLIPILGGISGGILGDKLAKDDWKKKLPDKVKEGTYQYLNNIFLCNIGAGTGILLMDKLNVKSKAIRFSVIMAGVAGAGLVAGNAVANFVCKNVIDPIFNKKPCCHKTKNSSMFKDLNKERHPELLDLGLHVDDLASVGFLSGINLLGPLLPTLYSISGYRAGIGYRNGSKNSP